MRSSIGSLRPPTTRWAGVQICDRVQRVETIEANYDAHAGVEFVSRQHISYGDDGAVLRVQNPDSCQGFVERPRLRRTPAPLLHLHLTTRADR